MYQRWRLFAYRFTLWTWGWLAVVLLALTAVAELGCGWQLPKRLREPKLLWKTELPRPWPNMLFSMPVSDREDKIVIVTGQGAFSREDQRIYGHIICCVADATSGELIDTPTHRVEFGEIIAKPGQERSRGGILLNYSSFVFPAFHPTTFPCSPEKLVVVLERLELRFYSYNLRDKKWTGPFIPDPPIRCPDEGLVHAEALWDRGKLYCFHPTAVIAIQKNNTTDRYTEYDLLEFNLAEPQVKGKKLFTQRVSKSCLDVVRPSHPGDVTFKWECVLDDKEYLMEYNSDTNKVTVLVEKAYDINNTELRSGPTCIYDPHRKKFIQAKWGLHECKTWLVERNFGEKGGKTVWPRRGQEQAFTNYLIATARFDKLALIMRMLDKDDDTSFEENLIVILDARTYREQYRWIETVWGLYGAQFSRDGKKLYVATMEPIDKKAKDVKYKDYLKCYQLEE